MKITMPLQKVVKFDLSHIGVLAKIFSQKKITRASDISYLITGLVGDLDFKSRFFFHFDF